MTTVLEEREGEYTLVVPRDVVKDLHLHPGAALDLSVEGERLVARRARPKYTLAQLLEEHAQVIDELGENREWIDAPRVGRELI